MRRSHTHFKALDDAIDEFTGRKPYEVVHDFESEPGNQLMRFEIRERPSPAWSPIVGDIVYNVRSALDHLAWQLVIRNERNPRSHRPQFPIFTRDPLDPSIYSDPEEAKRARVSWKNQVRGMHKADVELLKRLQPYNGPDSPDDHPLARLNQLSNWDKHREFHFAGQAFMDYRIGVKAMKDVRVKLLYLKSRGEGLKDGDIIARYGVVATGPNPKLDMNLKVFFDVAFGEGSPLEGLGIKETFPTLINHVMDIILEFKDRFTYQDFSPPF
jgi:hypothetical protein